MKIQVVIFDLGGVLVKLEPRRMLDKLVKATGQSVDALQQLLVEPSLLEPFELGRISARQYFHRVTQRVRLTWTFQEFAEAWNSVLSENLETVGLLPRLKEQYALSVLTNTNELHDEHIRHSWPVFRHVHHWIASYRVGLRKPDPEIFHVALRQVQATPDVSVFIDDTKGHVEAAQRMGLTALQFTDAPTLEQDLRAVGLHI